MKSFCDCNGKKYNIELNLGSAKRVKSECGIDLINSIEFQNGSASVDSLTRLSEDPYLLVSVLYVLCKVTPGNAVGDEADFENGFDGDSIENAIDALMQEIIDFFPHAKRKVVKAIYEKSSLFKKTAESKLDEVLTSKEFNEGLESQLNSLLSNSQE